MIHSALVKKQRITISILFILLLTTIIVGMELGYASLL